MSRATVLAGAAGVLAVLGAWEALAAAEAGLRGTLGRALAPLRRAGEGGDRPSAAERRRLGLLGAGVGGLGGGLLGGPFLAVALAAAGPAAVLALARRRHERWRAALAREAPLAARALADAVGAGYSVRGALGEASRHLGGAAGRELRAVSASLALGAPTEAALERLRDRARGEAWDTLAAAILLQRDAGGDLALLLRGIATAREEAARLERDGRTATAQARYTGLVICGMPLAAAGLALLVAPSAVTGMLRSPASAVPCGLALVVQLGCLWAIRRLARLPE